MEGTFIVLEIHGGWKHAAIVTDEEGNNKIFKTFEEAETESKECQDGLIVGDEIVGDTQVNQLLDLLISMDMAINPGTYPSTESLDTVDFLDLAYCKAQELGLVKEFKSLQLVEQSK